MSFQVVFTDKAKKQLTKMDKSKAILITKWLRENIDGCSNPRKQGKGLTANLSKKWRYRVENYRIIADIQDDKVIVLVLEVAHRKDIYK